MEKNLFLFAGIHYIGEMHRDSISRVLVDQLTEGQVTWSQLDDEYDVVSSVTFLVPLTTLSILDVELGC